MPELRLYVVIDFNYIEKPNFTCAKTNIYGYYSATILKFSNADAARFYQFVRRCYAKLVWFLPLICR